MDTIYLAIEVDSDDIEGTREWADALVRNDLLPDAFVRKVRVDVAGGSMDTRTISKGN
jgi:hypothetical protein